MYGMEQKPGARQCRPAHTPIPHIQHRTTAAAAWWAKELDDGLPYDECYMALRPRFMLQGLS